MPKRVTASDVSVQITVRVDPALLDRADTLRDSVTARNGIPAARADVWREALVKGLAVLEAEARGSAPAARKSR